MKISRILIGCILVLCGCVFAVGQTGNGSGSGNGIVTDSSLPRVTAPYKILKQPKAKYTKAARKHGLEGSVILKITLLANGEIGAVTFVPRDRAEEVEKYGLVESAIQAARKIKFIPKKVNGVLMPVIITREYTFSFY